MNTIDANNYPNSMRKWRMCISESWSTLSIRELRGLAASIGIRKDKPFAPDARMKAILIDAVAIGECNRTALYAFETREKEALL